MAKARKRNKGQKAKLADKQAEAAAVETQKKEKDKLAKTSKPKGEKIPRRKREDWTEAEILADLEKREKALARLRRELTIKRNPELISLKKRLDEAEKSANMHNRFVRQRELAIEACGRKLDALRNRGGLFTRGGQVIVDKGLLDILEEQEMARSLVRKLQAELEEARVKAGVSEEPAEVS